MLPKPPRLQLWLSRNPLNKMVKDNKEVKEEDNQEVREEKVLVNKMFKVRTTPRDLSTPEKAKSPRESLLNPTHKIENQELAFLVLREDSAKMVAAEETTAPLRTKSKILTNKKLPRLRNQLLQLLNLKNPLLSTTLSLSTSTSRDSESLMMLQFNPLSKDN